MKCGILKSTDKLNSHGACMSGINCPGQTDLHAYISLNKRGFWVLCSATCLACLVHKQPDMA